jgi:hypothetical protein
MSLQGGRAQYKWCKFFQDGKEHQDEENFIPDGVMSLQGGRAEVPLLKSAHGWWDIKSSAVGNIVELVA